MLELSVFYSPGAITVLLRFFLPQLATLPNVLHFHLRIEFLAAVTTKNVVWGQIAPCFSY
jgi:hypothetical protein